MKYNGKKVVFRREGKRMSTKFRGAWNRAMIKELVNRVHGLCKSTSDEMDIIVDLDN